MIELTAEEVRVLGCLIEKEKTTPEYYPLTLNAITLACNQKSNRDPVVRYDQQTVVRALDELRIKKITWQCLTPGSRVPKYQHNFSDVIACTQAEEAVLAILMLRGPQTVGEIKGRSGRLYEFQALDEVQDTLDALMTRDENPLVIKLPRQVGRKESRYAQLLSGEPEIEDVEVAMPKEQARIAVDHENQRIAKLEETVEGLQDQLSELQNSFIEFTKQFE
jgi:uncharacterized protein